ncbi:MAG: transcription elongation factor Elf1 [Paraglaciecola sp.]|jgi:transcription elongation factor Elf1
MNITNFIILDGQGNELASDASGENLAFACPECGHPVIANSKNGKHGSCEDIPSVCKGCSEKYFLDIRKRSEKLYVFNVREFNA